MLKGIALKIKAPRGTRDLLPEDMEKYRFIEGVLRETFETFGYKEVQTPIFEKFELFALRSGDEIRNTMFTFETGEGEMALRPEMTAPICRMIAEGKINLTFKPIKLYYIGRCFRYEEPQAGRYREFWQAGVELIGSKEADADAELIVLATECLKRIGIMEYELILGDVGLLRKILETFNADYEVQNKILSDIDHTQSLINKLTTLSSREKLDKNELLALKRMVYSIEERKRRIRAKYSKAHDIISEIKPDTRVYRLNELHTEEIRELVLQEVEELKKMLIIQWCYEGIRIQDKIYRLPLQAGKILLRVLEQLEGDAENVLDKAMDMFKESEEVIKELERLGYIVDLLRSAGVNKVTVNLGLARGLEYYTGVVFEIHFRRLGAQSQICGGGRYDRLISEFGGPNVPAAGFAFGLDRLVLALDLQGITPPRRKVRRVLVVPVKEEVRKEAFLLALRLRREGIQAEMCLAGESLREALFRANKLNIRYVIIVGPKELSRGCIVLRDMVERLQREVSLDELPKVIT